jgi:hypothetical protein
VQVGRRDLLGGGDDRTKSAQDASGDDPAERDGDHRHEGERDPGIDQELVQSLGPLVFQGLLQLGREQLHGAGLAGRHVQRGAETSPGEEEMKLVAMEPLTACRISA